MDEFKVLVIEDDEDILELIVFNLEKEGFKVLTATTGEEGYITASAVLPNLILLDVMLPGMDGLMVLRKLRGSDLTKNIPVIMVTARTEDIDVIVGLELGADDYITKPFSITVLTARVRAFLRRLSRDDINPVESNEEDLIFAGPLIIDLFKRRVEGISEAESLTATEFDILVFLGKKPGRVFTRAQIIDGVKGDDYPVTDRSVDVQIVSLRKKLGSHGALIRTIRGVGYSFRT
ncbi:MAG: response regulator [Deltaproteobacteria bacterium]|nr:response regulator [Deltaproteobacteria bacterium]